MAVGASVELRSLRKDYGNVVALATLSLAIKEGEFVTLLGPSGSGKTTTLMMVAGFEAPTAGSILISGESVVNRPPYRRNIGVVFQSYALFPHMTVEANVAYPLRMRRVGGNEVRRRVAAALDRVQLGGLGGRHPGQLSGASSSGSPSRARWCSSRRSSSWTSRWARSTRICGRTCSSRSSASTARSG
jgi:putative spermidine/putrescine transport system ATP-binding protein